MNKSVLVLGSSCVDVIIRVNHLPKREENLHPDSQQFRLGGCACNVAHILGHGGAALTFVTPIGMKGVFGPWVLGALKDLSWASPVILEEAENGCCYCLVEPDGERTFMSIHGAEYTFSAEWMRPFENRSFDYAYVCGLEVEEKTGGDLVTWLEHAPLRNLFYAPGPRGIHIPAERTNRLLALHPILHLNRNEALQMSGADSPEAAMTVLHGRTGRPVILTLGAEGALILDTDGTIRPVPGVPHVRVMDTIGAGDAHAGAILLGLSRGWPLTRSVELANRVSALVVAQEGAVLRNCQILAESSLE
ncbi:MAG: carbohydrate kinase family protein [Clostridia bacterium]|nr:carbohydrate kinase family protein [Clostridia bacterium]